MGLLNNLSGYKHCTNLSTAGAYQYRYTADLVSLSRHYPLADKPINQLCKVASPLSDQLRAWRRRLTTHPDQVFASYILDGLQCGFRIGFDYSCPLTAAKRNMPSALQHPDVVDAYL